MKKRYLLIIPLILFGMFMSYINNRDEENKLKTPQIGDFYVFDNLLRNKNLIGENIFKISKITNDSIYFYIPKVSFPLAASIDNEVIEEAIGLDRENEMFSYQQISISKKDISKYRENASFKNRMDLTKKDSIRLISIH